jgi:hypothetical protein
MSTTVRICKDSFYLEDFQLHTANVLHYIQNVTKQITETFE